MTITILILLSGMGLLLMGVGLLGTLLGVRATIESFSNIEIGLVMAGYYAGYIAGTLLIPRMIQNVGHIRTFAALAAVAAATCLLFSLAINPWIWFVLRAVSGLCVVGIYLVVESWLNEQSVGPARGRIFSLYMMSTLIALGSGQFLLVAGDSSGIQLFSIAAVFITLGVVPIAVNRVTEPRIEKTVPVRLSQLITISPLGVIGVLSAGVLSGLFWGMTPVFGQRFGLEEGQIALLMSATILGGATLNWPIGHLSDLADRRVVLILSSLATALTAAAAAFIVAVGYSGLILSAFVYGGLMFSLYGISVAHTNDHLEQGQALEATRGLLFVFGFGALCGPLLGGIAMESAGPVGLPAVSAATAVALALYGLYRVTQRPSTPLADQTKFIPMVRTSPVSLEMHPYADPEPEFDLTRGPE